MQISIFTPKLQNFPQKNFHFLFRSQKVFSSLSLERFKLDPKTLDPDPKLNPKLELEFRPGLKLKLRLFLG